MPTIQSPLLLGELPGVIKMYGGSTAPSGYLMCDGSAVSRTAYANLFAVIGTAWGPGDGSTTFNLPNAAGRAPIGAGTDGQGTVRNLGDKGGTSTGTHTHPLNGTGAGAGIRLGGDTRIETALITVPSYNTTQMITGAAAGSASTSGRTNAAAVMGNSDVATQWMPPYFSPNFIIKT